MSSTSLNDLSKKYLNKSLSENDGSQQSDEYSSIRSTEDRSSKGSIEQDSNYENSPSTRSMRIQISPISAALNSTNEKIESYADLGDIATSTQFLQTESDSFNSHTYSNYNQKIDFHSDRMIKEQSIEDLQLPLVEELHAVPKRCIMSCAKSGFRNDRDPIENLVAATLAFKEASHNQCDLLRAQTSAINRLATAIEDQNVMMSRFHNIAERTSNKSVLENGNPPRGDKQ